MKNEEQFSTLISDISNSFECGASQVDRYITDNKLGLKIQKYCKKRLYGVEIKQLNNSIKLMVWKLPGAEKLK